MFQAPLGGNNYSILCEVSYNCVFKALVHHLRSLVFSHAVALVLQTYTTLTYPGPVNIVSIYSRDWHEG